MKCHKLYQKYFFHFLRTIRGRINSCVLVARYYARELPNPSKIDSVEHPPFLKQSIHNITIHYEFPFGILPSLTGTSRSTNVLYNYNGGAVLGMFGYKSIDWAIMLVSYADFNTYRYKEPFYA